MKRLVEGPQLRADIARDDLLSDYGELVNYLVDTEFDDGSARRTSTLLVFVEDGVVKVCLNDRENGRSAWASGKTLRSALESLNAAVGSDCAEWKGSRASGPGNRTHTPPF